MDNLHILHLGGLELHELNAQNRFSQVNTVVARLENHEIDFIVVAGNLTRNRDFDLLGRFLKRLEPLVKLNKRRIVLAPGELDLGESENVFADFHQQYFGDDVQPPLADTIDVRQFRDVTFIAGVLTRSAKSETELVGVQKRVSERAEVWGSASVRHELRILATAANPLLTAPEVLFSSAAMAQFQREIDVLLCGPGNPAIVPTQPFGRMPFAVGIPLATVRPGLDSLYWNILCLRVPPRPRDFDLSRVQLKLKSYDEDREYERPAHSYSSGHYETTHPHIDSVLLCKETLLLKLKGALTDGRSGLIEVLGYGDVWKTVIAEGLHSTIPIGPHYYLVRRFPIKWYPEDPEEGSFSQWKNEDIEVLEDIEAWRRSQRHQGPNLIALVVDDAFSPEEPDDKNRADEIKNRIAIRFNGGPRIVYLMSAYGSPSKNRDNITRVPLDPIAAATLNLYIELASCEFPIDQHVFRALTGGYLGFIKLMADALRDQYKRLDKYQISPVWRFDAEVIAACQHSDDLRREATLFFDFLCLPKKGKLICDTYIDRLCRLKDANERRMLSDEVAITVEEAQALDIEFDLEELRRKGIVGYEDKDRSYVLKERIPFLVQVLRPIEKVVFVSYAEEDVELVRRLRTSLSEEDIDDWEWQNAMDVASGLDRDIERHLNLCKIVVVLWTRNSVNSDRVRKEARLASSTDKRRLLNWFHDVVPAPHLPKQKRRKKEGIPLPESDSSGRAVSQHLVEFDNGIPAYSAEEVIQKLKHTLHPLRRCPRMLTSRIDRGDRI